jgi:hypothetical protein
MLPSKIVRACCSQSFFSATAQITIKHVASGILASILILHTNWTIFGFGQVPGYCPSKATAPSQSTSGSASCPCPMPELGKEINKAYDAWKLMPNEINTINLLSGLEKAIPKYDCRRKIDKAPVPAWWLADYQSIENWIDFLSSVIDNHFSPALRIFMDFFITADGYIAEEMTWQMIKMIRSDPIFILENWTAVRPYQEAVYGIRHMLEPEDIDDIAMMYKKISAEEPLLYAACLEIIDGLRKRKK